MPAKPKRVANGVTLDQLRKLVLALPEVREKPSYGTPGFRVRDKLFARVLDDGESVVIKMSLDQREVMVAAAPKIFWVTPHYEGYPMVIVNLTTVKRAMLEELLAEAWRIVAPPKLAAAYDDTRRK